MVLSLVIISMVAAGALAGVYMLTERQIELQKQQKQLAAEKAVLAGHADGVAIEAKADGFGGEIKVMVGFAPDGTILGYEILEQQETPGLGTHIVEWFKDQAKPAQNIVGRKADGKMKVSKDGGDVDAITAATISSRAFLRAVNEAYSQFAEQAGLEKPDGMAGASIVRHEEAQEAGSGVIENDEKEMEEDYE